MEKLGVDDLAGKVFIIPFYQRGYRWTSHEARKLVQDLRKFSQSSEPEYSLQPIVLQKASDEKIQEDNTSDKNIPEDLKTFFRVVDGQQRLTTIAILMRVLGLHNEWDIYYKAEKKRFSKLSLEEDETINDRFRREVKETFREISDKETIKEIFNKITFLCYEIHADRNDHQEGHLVFLRLNGAKTPLTSSELIRALYMVSDSKISEQEQMEISKEWELMENALRNEQFWLMFRSEGLSDTQTRIDLLFALVRNIDLKMAKANPKIIFENMDQDKNLDLMSIWKDVLRCFWWMQSCYDDIELFNYLCWIREFTEDSASKIYKIWCHHPKREDFKKRIIGIIQEKYCNQTLSDFSYDSGRGELLPLLVLLNILDCNHCRERFRFDLYKNESWDIEHIDSQTPNATEEVSGIVKHQEENISEDKKINDEDKNGLGNLVLLNSSTNRSYKNALFSDKRKTIKQNIVSGTCYVLPCTAKAFMKFYTESPSKITYWLKDDFDAYLNQMKEYLEKFLATPSLDDTDEKQTQQEKEEISNAEKPERFSDQRPDRHGRPSGHAISNTEKPERFSAPVSFIDFMDQYSVVIPKIQRLYVQGRQDCHGKKCLSSFAQYLVNGITKNEEVSLDFIYGIETQDGKTFLPLDGQQRLTTLLLLAWLCRKTTSKWSFRYESRRAAECFIQGLLRHAPPDLTKPGDYDEMLRNQKGKDYLPLCSDSIRESDWFLPAWEADPGIAGMLEMLDSLYCRLLVSETKEFNFDKISFSVRYLNVCQESYDQIFLRMNARGKMLTPWEICKAILDKNAPETLPRTSWHSWEEFLWEHLDKKGISDLDAKMLSVVELASMCAGCKSETPDIALRLAQWLEQPDKNKEKMEFYILCNNFFSALEKKQRKNTELQKALKPYWGESAPCLWPDFGKDTQQEFYKPLLAYYAALQSCDKKWMRVIWNILENTEVTKKSFPKLYRWVTKLSKRKDNILDFLSKVKILKKCGKKIAQQNKDDRLFDQLREESIKAKIYQNAEQNKEKIELLQKAENNLHGRVRLGILNLKEKRPDFSEDRLKKLNELFEAWNTAKEDSEKCRKTIVLNIVAAEPFKLQDKIYLSTEDDNLRALLTTRDDQSIQEHLSTMDIDRIPDKPFSEWEADASSKWKRDWRQSLLNIAKGVNGYNVYTKYLWEKGRHVHYHEGRRVYALYSNSKISGALPIGDWRIELGVEGSPFRKWYKERTKGTVLTDAQSDRTDGAENKKTTQGMELDITINKGDMCWKEITWNGEKANLYLGSKQISIGKKPLAEAPISSDALKEKIETELNNLFPPKTSTSESEQSPATEK